MRYVLAFLSGLVGMAAGWFGAAMAVIALEGLGNDGGIGMAAFFQVGPIGGLIGFVLGFWLCLKVARGIRRSSLPDDPKQTGVSPP